MIFFNFDYIRGSHMIRDQVPKWSRTLITWVPHMGKRQRGRPVIRWEDELKAYFGKSRKYDAKDRAR